MEQKLTRQELINRFDDCRDTIETYLARMDRLSWAVIRYNNDIHSEEAQIGWNMLRITEEITKVLDTDITKTRY